MSFSMQDNLTAIPLDTPHGAPATPFEVNKRRHSTRLAQLRNGRAHCLAPVHMHITDETDRSPSDATATPFLR